VIESLDTLSIVALALVVGGVVGSVVPLVPSGVLSLSGVYLYWWHTGYDEPGVLLLSGLTLLGLVLVAVELLAGAISAKAGGASTRTTLLATLVGFVGLFVAGPIGFLAGTAGTVFVLEYESAEGIEASARVAAVTLLGMLTSNLLQVLLSGGVALVMIWVVVW